MERCYENLAQAVIVITTKDYIRACKKLKKHPMDFDAKHIKKECLEFFRGNLFSSLTEIDPEWLIDKLDMEVGN